MLKFHFLNVDNGDCTIIEHLNGDSRSFGLIDCNRTPTKQTPALDKLIALGAERLEFVCVTHPDKDHFSGIVDVLDHYEGKIGTFFTFPLSTILTDVDRLKAYLAQIKVLAERGDDEDFSNRHVEFMEIVMKAYQRFLPAGDWIEVTGDHDRMAIAGFGAAQFHGIMPPKKMRGEIVQTVLNVEPQNIKSLDNNAVSAAILVSYAGRSIVLGGDAINANWIWHRAFRAKLNMNIDSDLVKLPHHGSRKDNSAQTLADFFSDKPDAIAIISAGGRSHPDLETLHRLDEHGCTRLCTNLFNPNERALKRLYQNPALSQQLKHYLNVYSEPHVAAPVPCKGDICVSISPGGAITIQTEFQTLCGCTKSLAGFSVLAQAHP